MVTQVRHPIWLPAVRSAGAKTFATLYAFESFARATVSSVIPIQAYEILQNKQEVSILYTIVALPGLSATLFMPMIIEKLSRRWVYTIGAGFLAFGSAFFVTHTLPGQVIGMLFRVMGASALAITLNLYIMDHIRKADVMQSESLRMAWSMIAWTGGPTLGVLLYTHFGIFAPHLLVVAFAATLLVFFWYFRLSDNAQIRPGKTKAANPLKNIGRFVAQPRLRLAWMIAFGRSCFWTTFFVYGPILMVVTGQGELAGGLLVSAGNALLFMAIFWGRAGRRFGVRTIMTVSFFALSGALALAGLCGERLPIWGGAFLLGLSVETDEQGRMTFNRDGEPVLAFASEYEMSRSQQLLRAERSLTVPFGLPGAHLPQVYVDAGLGDPSDFWEAVDKGFAIGDGPQHQMFGITGVNGLANLQKQAAEYAAKQGWSDIATGEGWFILIKLASGGEADFSFSDHGDYIFMVNRKDAAKGDFSRVYAFVESG